MERDLKAFVSSTFEDLKEHRRFVIGALRGAGLQVDPMEDWQASSDEPRRFSVERVKGCDLCILLVALRRGYVPEGETQSITQMEYRYAYENGIPVLAFLLDENAPWPRKYDESARDDSVLSWRASLLARHGVSPFGTEPTSVPIKDALIRWLRERPAASRSPETPEPVGVRPAAACLVSLDRLHLQAGQEGFFGCDEEVRALDEGWSSSATHVACLVGFGGAGKTALAHHWVTRLLAREDKGGASRVYGWSFESPGADQKEMSATAFFDDALRWFGETSIPTVPRQCGVRLAELVAAQRAVLLLDRADAVQGDPAVLALLQKLAESNRGLCVVTTRSDSADLAPWVGRTVLRIPVKGLPASAGALLLRHYGVRGSDEEIVATVKEYRGHALSLALLGRFLREWKNGEVGRRREGIDLREPDGAKRLVESYERTLGDGPEMDLLRVLGLFGGPAAKSAIDAVRAAPPIVGLTERIAELKGDRWTRAVGRLEALGLLTEVRRGVAEAQYDTHAIVRNHFAARLREERAEAWRRANARLYEYYRRRPGRDLPDALTEMDNLFQAVVHGCRAGMHARAWAEVYWPRIRREQDGFSVMMLNAWSRDLVAVSHFFEASDWERPVAALDDFSAANACTEAGFDLRGLSRLEEAITAYEEGLRRHLALGKLWEACDAAGNLAENCVLHGDLSRAEQTARQSISLAREAFDSARSDAERRNAQKTLATNLGTLGEVLHQQGSLRQAEEQSAEAERLLRETDPSARFLPHLRGYHHVALLLALERIDEAELRAFCMAEAGRRSKKTYAVGLAHLAMARIRMARGDRAGDGVARRLMDVALQEMRESGHEEMILRGLLASAMLHRLARQHDLARKELEEVLEISRRGPMRLLEIDAHLGLGFLAVAEGRHQAVAEHAATARAGIEQTGYHRRDGRLLALEQGRAEAPVGAAPLRARHVPFKGPEQDFVHVYLRGDPLAGTQLGIPGDHDRRLPILDPSERAEWLDALAAVARRMEASAAGGESVDDAVDAALARSGVEGMRLVEEQLRPATRNPGLYVDGAVRGIHALLMREDLAIDERAEGIFARVAGVPGLLAQGQKRLAKDPPRVLVDNSIGDAQGAVAFFEQELGQFVDSLPDGSAKAGLAKVREQALNAMGEFERFVSGLAEGATDRFALGKNAFEALLKDDHLVTQDVDGLETLGRSVVADLERELEATSRKAAGHARWWEVVAELESRAVTRETLLDEYRRVLEAARLFVERRDLVGLSHVRPVEVRATPLFARVNLPFAAYIPAPPFAEGGRGEFWVTPPADGLSEGQELEVLRRHHPGRLLVACVHESYPGHHVQFEHAAGVKRPMRHLFASNVFAEGWGLYCEHLMRTEGFLLNGPDGPLLEISLLRDQLWRALRILVDVGLHCRNMTRQEAVAVFVDRHVLDRASAEAEVMYYCGAPTQPMSYMVGRLLMQDLVEKSRVARGGGATPLGRVRDEILSHGSLPFPLLERPMRLVPAPPGSGTIPP